jgi:hypothetical protein
MLLFIIYAFLLWDIAKIFFKHLYADKSYISKKLKTQLLHTKHIEIITPYKKNKKLVNTKEELEGLKNRMIIE